MKVWWTMPTREAARLRGAPDERMVQITERKRGVMDQNSASWNRIARWLGRMEALRAAA